MVRARILPTSLPLRAPARTVPTVIALALTLIALALSGLLGPGLRAQSAPSVVSTTQLLNLDAGEVAFDALLDRGDLVESAILFYRVLPQGAITRLTAEVSGGEVARLSAKVPVNRAQIWIPAGSDIEWFWELTTSDGDVIETNPQLWRYEDPRFTWIEIGDEHLSLWYYGDNEATAQRLHREGSAVIAEISELLKITLDFKARIYMWANPEDGGVFEQRESESFEQQVITGGTRVLADLVHIYQPTTWVTRHELTHILTKVAGEGGIGQLPSWLDEGLATYSEEDWRARRGAALNFAIDTDQLFTVRTMASLTNSPGRIDIFYGQAGDIVTFLVNDFGEDKLADLFAVFKAGSTVDNALETVYGFDRDGLTDAYRETLGLEPIGDLEDRSTVIEDGPAQLDAAEQASEEAAPAGAATDSAPADDESVETIADTGPRTQEQIDARRDEIERRLATRRLGPVFSSGGDFPWEGVATGVGAGTLLVSVVLLSILLSGGRAGPVPEGSASATFRPPPQPAPILPPPSTTASTTDAPTSPLPADDDAQWSGWRRSDDD
ncbi:MAG: peptidase MA family metallohydrolase [Chloroflexi bacterium]|nr:peptidase MA family metallohydrolase [Chloroflexota bacterium]